MDNKYIFLSGFGASGTSAVRDYLKQFDENYVVDSEFWLFRIHNGINSLYRDLFLYYQGSTHRELIVHKFRKEMILLNSYKYNRTKKFYLKKEYRTNVLGRSFKTHLDNFLKSIRINEIYAYSFHLDLIKTKRKLLLELMNFLSQVVLRKMKIIKKISYPKEKIGLYTSDINLFRSSLKTFMDKIHDTEKNNIVLFNGESAKNPLTGLHILKPSKMIILLRDPRDIYVTAIQRGNSWYVGANNIDPLKRVRIFIDNYKENVLNLKDLKVNPNIMLLHFEDFVLKYKEYSKKINHFLELETKIKHEFTYYNPELSRKNLQIYVDHPISEIQLIERELSEFLYFK